MVIAAIFNGLTYILAILGVFTAFVLILAYFTRGGIHLVLGSFVLLAFAGCVTIGPLMLAPVVKDWPWYVWVPIGVALVTFCILMDRRERSRKCDDHEID